MLTKKNNIKELQKQLVNNTEVVSVAIFFGEKDQVSMNYTYGKVLCTHNDRVCWKTSHKKKRTLLLSTFGQLIPGLNYDVVTFYGLFFKEDDAEKFNKELLILAKKLRTEMLKYCMFLNNTVEKLEDLNNKDLYE